MLKRQITLIESSVSQDVPFVPPTGLKRQLTLASDITDEGVDSPPQAHVNLPEGVQPIKVARYGDIGSSLDDCSPVALSPVAIVARQHSLAGDDFEEEEDKEEEEDWQQQQQQHGDDEHDIEPSGQAEPPQPKPLGATRQESWQEDLVSQGASWRAF